MIRKFVLILMAAISVFAAIVFICGRFQFVHWRFVPIANDNATLAVLVTNGAFDAGISGTWYAKNPGDVNSYERCFSFETLRLGWKVHAGACQTAWDDDDVRDYEGYRRIELAGPWWAPLFICLFFGMWPFLFFWDGPLLRWRRRRRGVCVWCGHDPPASAGEPCAKCGRTADGKRVAKPKPEKATAESKT